MPSPLATRLLADIDTAAAALVPSLGTPLASLAHSTNNIINLSAPVAKAPLASGLWSGTLDIDASAKLGFSAMADADAKAAGVPPESGKTMLALGVAAAARLDLAGTRPIGVFSVGLTADAGLDCNLQWIYACDSAATAGAALQGIAGSLQDPFSLASVRAMQAASPAFRQVRLEVDGTVDAGVKLTAGVEATGWTWSVSGANRTPIGVSLGLSGSARMRLGRLFHLSATRDGADLRVKLERDAKTSGDFGLELGVSGDVSAWLTDAAGLLTSSLPDPARWASQLLPILEPMTFVQNELRAGIAALLPDPTEQLLAQLALGLTSASTAQSTLVGDISTAINDELSRGNTQLSARLATLFDDALPAVIVNKTHLAQTLSNRVVAWLAAKADVQALATNLDTAFGSALQPIVNALGAFGSLVQARLGAIVPAPGPLATAISAALQDYATLRQKWISALTDAANAKIGLAIGVKHSNMVDDDVLLDLTFNADCGPLGEELYASLARGQLHDLKDRILAATPGVTDNGSSLARRLQEVSGASVSLNLLGLNLQWTQQQSASLNVTGSLLSGDLNATGKSDADAATTSWFGHFETDLACNYALKVNSGVPSASMSFHGAYSFKGDKLGWAALSSLIESMSPLCDVPALPDLAARLGLPGASSTHLPPALSDLDIVLPLQLTSDEMAAVTGSTLTFESVARIVLQVADTAYDKHGPLGSTFPSDMPSVVMAGLADEVGIEALMRSIKPWSDHSQIVVLLGGATSTGDTSPLADRARALSRMVGVTVGIANMRQALQSIQQGINTAALSTDTGQQTALLRLLADIAVAITPAAITPSGIGNDVAMPWALTAFATVLATLAGRPLPGAFVPVAQVTQGGQSRTFVLTAQ